MEMSYYIAPQNGGYNSDVHLHYSSPEHTKLGSEDRFQLFTLRPGAKPGERLLRGSLL
jgi:hypothetical protein